MIKDANVKTRRDSFPSGTIFSFRGKHRFLSNFWPARVTYENETYETVENAYQAAKFTDLAVRFAIRQMSPGDAKTYARKLKDHVRSDWVKLDHRFVVMTDLVFQKFDHPDLRDMLLATGVVPLVELNTWDDTYWGMVEEGEWLCGRNRLGVILMGCRGRLIINSLYGNIDQDQQAETHDGDGEAPDTDRDAA